MIEVGQTARIAAERLRQRRRDLAEHAVLFLVVPDGVTFRQQKPELGIDDGALVAVVEDPARDVRRARQIVFLHDEGDPRPQILFAGEAAVDVETEHVLTVVAEECVGLIERRVLLPLRHAGVLGGSGAQAAGMGARAGRDEALHERVDPGPEAALDELVLPIFAGDRPAVPFVAVLDALHRRRGADVARQEEGGVLGLVDERALRISRIAATLAGSVSRIELHLAAVEHAVELLGLTLLLAPVAVGHATVRARPSGPFESFDELRGRARTRGLAARAAAAGALGSARLMRRRE